MNYLVNWGISVYYKEQFNPKYYHKKLFENKKEADYFIKELNKEKKWDFVGCDIINKELKE